MKYRRCPTFGRRSSDRSQRQQQRKRGIRAPAVDVIDYRSTRSRPFLRHVVVTSAHVSDLRATECMPSGVLRRQSASGATCLPRPTAPVALRPDVTGSRDVTDQ